MKFIRVQRIVPVLVAGAALYGIFHRTTQDFLEGTFPIAAFLATISYGFFVTRWSIFGLPKISVHLFLLPLLYLPIFIAVSTIAYYGIGVALLDSYVWLQRQSPPRAFFVTLVGFLILIIGYTLFLFRLHVRFFFGLTEALVGVLIALHNVPANPDPALWSSDIFIVMLTAGVFLVVRGLDNMHTGLKSEPGDAFLKGVAESEYGDRWRALRDANKTS